MRYMAHPAQRVKVAYRTVVFYTVIQQVYCNLDCF